jgi:hypothetical protein
MSDNPSIGRHFQIAGDGLNDYLQLVAPSGTIIGWIGPDGVIAGSMIPTPSGGSSAPTLKLTPVILSGGTDAIDPHTPATYLVKTPGVDAMTIVAPTVGVDDGNVITITNGSSASHTVTFTGGTLRSGGAGVTTATFGAFQGSTFSFYAYQGVYYVLSQNLMASYS